MYPRFLTNRVLRTRPVGILDERVDDGYCLARQSGAGLRPQGRQAHLGADGEAAAARLSPVAVDHGSGEDRLLPPVFDFVLTSGSGFRGFRMWARHTKSVVLLLALRN